MVPSSMVTTATNLKQNRVLEKMVITYLVKKFPVFYGPWKFITVFTRARQ